MPNRNYQKGRQREYDVAERYRRRGYTVVRGAGSHDDLIAGKRGYVTQLIEVKATKTPYAGFGPEERKRMIERADRAGWMPVLVWWPYDRGGPRFLPKEVWPDHE